MTLRQLINLLSNYIHEAESICRALPPHFQPHHHPTPFVSPSLPASCFIVLKNHSTLSPSHANLLTHSSVSATTPLCNPFTLTFSSSDRAGHRECCSKRNARNVHPEMSRGCWKHHFRTRPVASSVRKNMSAVTSDEIW